MALAKSSPTGAGGRFGGGWGGRGFGGFGRFGGVWGGLVLGGLGGVWGGGFGGHLEPKSTVPLS